MSRDSASRRTRSPMLVAPTIADAKKPMPRRPSTRSLKVKTVKTTTKTTTAANKSCAYIGKPSLPERWRPAGRLPSRPAAFARAHRL